MKKYLDIMMYISFSLSALPFSLLGLYNLFYFYNYPEQLEVRDTFTQLFPLLAFLPFTLIMLLIGLGIGIYFILFGSKNMKQISFIIIGIWILFILVPVKTEFNSFEGLYWDIIPFVLLMLTPWVLHYIHLREN